MPKIAREHEDIEDALRVVWAKRVESGQSSVNSTQFALVLADTLKKLQVAPPNNKWYSDAFRNFDLDKDGWIEQSDVIDICVQYVNAYLQLNNSKDMCWKSFCFVDNESTGKINRSQMKTAMTMVFDQLLNVTMPTDQWFSDAFTNFDIDKDGFLNFDELVEIVDQYVEALRRSGVKVTRKNKREAKDSLDSKLCKLTKGLLADIDPTNSGRITADQTVDLIKKLWKAVPDMGRQPSTRWCRDAFTNFDVKKQGHIAVESWCEIVRQYAWWKLGQWPEGFTYQNIQAAASASPSRAPSRAGKSSTATPRPNSKGPASRGGAGSKAGAKSGGGGNPNGIMEAVHFTGHIIVPTYSGKLKVFDDYEFLEKKGEGAFGKVMTVRHNRTGIMRACKSIALKNKDQTKLVETEIELMKQLDHPNILRLYETYYDGDQSIYLVTELCNGGSLFDRLIYHMKSLKRPMSERQSGRYIQQIMQALAYCHSMGIIHRDVKPDNVLFVNRKADSAVKVIDFGLSDFMRKIEQAAKTVKINKDKEKIAEGIRRSLGIAVPGATDPLLRKVMPKAGTPHYMPPEMHHKAWYDEKADVFACGVMLYQMLTGIHPFFIPGKDNAETAKQKIVLCKVDYPPDAWNQISPLAKNLTQAMLEEDPKIRLSSHDALKHKWFASSKKVTTDLRASVVDDMVAFQQHNKLKQAVLRLLAKEVDEALISDLREQFVAMDTDGDGILQLEEVLSAAEKCKINISKKELEQTLFALHGPGLGETALEVGLNYRDFIASLLEKKVAIERGHLMEIFKRFEDPKEPGFITAKSIKDSIKAHKRTDGRKSITESEFSSDEMQDILGKDTKINFNTFLTIVYGGQINDSPAPEKGKK